MTMNPKQVGGRTVTAIILLLATLADEAFAQEHKTYRCKVADVVSLAHDGRLRSDSNPTTMMRQLYDGALIDTLTGAVTYSAALRLTTRNSAAMAAWFVVML
jgi:hypothetical protein